MCKPPRTENRIIVKKGRVMINMWVTGSGCMGVCDSHECEHGEKFRDAISSANLNRPLKS